VAEAKRKEADEEAKRKEAEAAEAKRKEAEEEAKRIAEAAAAAAAAAKRADDEAKRRAEEEAKRKADEEAKRREKKIEKRRKIYDDEEGLLFIKRSSVDSITYEIYYKALGDFNKDSEYTNISKEKEMNKSFNYLIYKNDNDILIKPIKKYYTLKDILTKIYESYDNIIIVSKEKEKDIGQETNILYQYKDYNKINLIFIYNDNNINNDVDKLIDAENNYEQNISQEDYNNIKEVIKK
jgi:hypothetical protein